MNDFKHLKLEQDDGVARITFARPKHNVFNIEMMSEFIDLLETLTGATDLKCLVILGEGASWCAGVDVGDHRPELAGKMIAAFNHSLALLESFPVTTIAAVHGGCLGGGMEFAIACDIVIAGRGAKFGQPEIKLGFFPPYAAVRLPQLIGPAKAVEICTTGKIYSAKQAVSMGFVSQCVDDDQFNEAVERTIKDLRACSPLIIRLNKQAVRDHQGLGSQEAIEKVSDLFLNRLMKTEDTLEGIASFYEKRRPEWKNR